MADLLEKSGNAGRRRMLFAPSQIRNTHSLIHWGKGGKSQDRGVKSQDSGVKSQDRGVKSQDLEQSPRVVERFFGLSYIFF